MFNLTHWPLRNWFKGADTVSLLAFLEHRVQSELNSFSNDDRPFFAAMLAAISAANIFMRCIYNSSLWFTPHERNVLLASGHDCETAFRRCASMAFNRGVTRWKYQPKFHMFGELLFQLEEHKRKNIPTLSFLCFCTQQDEDFIGRISVMSRAVSVRTVHLRTLTRYQIAVAALW